MPPDAILLTTAIATARSVAEQLRRAELSLKRGGPWQAHGLAELRSAIRQLELGIAAAERLQRL